MPGHVRAKGVHHISPAKIPVMRALGSHHHHPPEALNPHEGPQPSPSSSPLSPKKLPRDEQPASSSMPASAACPTLALLPARPPAWPPPLSPVLVMMTRAVASVLAVAVPHSFARLPPYLPPAAGLGLGLGLAFFAATFDFNLPCSSSASSEAIQRMSGGQNYSHSVGNTVQYYVVSTVLYSRQYI